MFDETFPSNVQMFDLLAIPVNKACVSGEKTTTQKQNLCDVSTLDVIISVAWRRKRYVESLWPMFGEILFARLTTGRFVLLTRCWTKRS